MSETGPFPRHVAIIMDGNGRWAKKRLMPRIAGHRVGVKSVRRAIDFCVRHNIDVLSLFALSVENFHSRPSAEIKFLLTLFLESLVKNLDEIHQNRIRIRIIGDLSVFDAMMIAQVRQAEALTAQNNGLTLVIAVNYSGRWDILQASKQLVQRVVEKKIDPAEIIETSLSQFLCLSDLPAPDLLIRTGGEQRISNFFLWQLAYSELCFIDAHWPDFNKNTFIEAIASYQKRERRFGLTGDQLAKADVC